MIVLELNADEFDVLLEAGWRKFGHYFFCPHCPLCRECRPIRIVVKRFAPSRSQRRVWRKNSDLRVERLPLTFRDDVYELYLKHSKRFKKNEIAGVSEFCSSFLSGPVEGFQMLYFAGEQLVAAGFLDTALKSVSSVYFVFDPEHEKRSLGTLGVLHELQWARINHKPFYYLGYWIKGLSTMEYKNRFHPYEIRDWSTGAWQKMLPE